MRNLYLRLARILLIIFIMIFFTRRSLGQQPGGVNGTKLWYVTTGNGYVDRMNDISGHDWKQFTSFSDIRLNDNINFHEAAYFNKSLIDRGPLKNFAFDQGTVVCIIYPREIQNEEKFVGISYGKRYTGIKYNSIDTNLKDKGYHYGNNTLRTNFEFKKPYTTKANAMKTLVYYYADDYNFHSVWGHDQQIHLSSELDGYMPEMMVYNRIISPLERRKIESYLSVKYGTTLDGSYIGPRGEALWDISDPLIKAFDIRVCAIGRDKQGAVWQPKSNSTYEEPYFGFSATDTTAFENDANGESFPTGNLVPRNDSTSKYRSLTIGFMDKSMKNVKEGTYLFWGDNDQPMNLEANEIDHTNFPGLLTPARKWLLRNLSNDTTKTKVEVSGSLHHRLYNLYDYLKFRYVLVSLKENTNQIDSTTLFSYFAREVFYDEQDRLNFYDYRMVWENKLWVNQGGQEKHYFTFGKVPLLRFYKVNDQKVRVHQTTRPVYVYSNIPISSQLVPDTLLLTDPKDSPLKVTISFTKGIPPYQICIQKVSPAKTPPLCKSLALSGLKGDSVIVLNPDPGSKESDTPKKADEPVEHDLGNVTYYDYPIGNLDPKSIYIITISDKVKQTETLAIKIKYEKK